MAAIRKVRKRSRVRWRVSWYDALGQRHQKFFSTRTEAAQQQADATKSTRHRLTPRVDPNVTVRAYATAWLRQHAIEQDLKPRTVESYDATLRLHILAVDVGTKTFGDLPVAAIRRPLVKALLAQQRAKGQSRDSVRITLAVLSAMFDAAVEDDLLVVNPAHRLRKALRLGTSQHARTEDVRAMTQEELDRALETARTHSSALYPLYVTLARTGLRIGEALALDDTDPEVFDFDARRLRVRRSLGRVRRDRDPSESLETPKSGHGRDVDLSQDLVAVLKGHIAEKKKAKLAGAWADLPCWTFCTSKGTPYSGRNVLRDWYRIQPLAKLVDVEGSPRFDLHSFRHTFAALHIVNGAKLSWLQEQLGHSDIRLTRTTYGRWFKLRDLAAADHQDARSRLVVTQMVTHTTTAG
jgi:integrase